VTVTANYFDSNENPIGGYLTFWPSAALTLTSGPVTTLVSQRYGGVNLHDNPGMSWGDRKMYLRQGNLMVSLLATDNVGVSMIPPSFTYHVEEHFYNGQEYDISVPSTSTSPVDIHSLIIPGTGTDENDNEDESCPVSFAAISTQYLEVNITAESGGIRINPTSDTVQFAFISGPGEPQSGDWNTGDWASINSPYTAQILIGPGAGGLVLAASSYIIWVKVISSPQVPIFPVGTLIIY
jgi:hypothetical protein